MPSPSPAPRVTRSGAKRSASDGAPSPAARSKRAAPARAAARAAALEDTPLMRERVDGVTYKEALTTEPAEQEQLRAAAEASLAGAELLAVSRELQQLRDVVAQQQELIRTLRDSAPVPAVAQRPVLGTDNPANKVRRARG